jgi:hypothetical protein
MLVRGGDREAQPLLAVRVLQSRVRLENLCVRLTKPHSSAAADGCATQTYLESTHSLTNVLPFVIPVTREGSLRHITLQWKVASCIR